eukprot:COSAG02_NODE_12910_length_1473_cov_1.967977_2_plen_167_part_00
MVGTTVRIDHFCTEFRTVTFDCIDSPVRGFRTAKKILFSERRSETTVLSLDWPQFCLNLFQTTVLSLEGDYRSFARARGFILRGFRTAVRSMVLVNEFIAVIHSVQACTLQRSMQPIPIRPMMNEDGWHTYCNCIPRGQMQTRNGEYRDTAVLCTCTVHSTAVPPG